MASERCSTGEGDPEDELEHSSSIHSPANIHVSQLDQDALRVISRLTRTGYEAYLVGGCVRDLLLGRQPKDFDVATAAHPRQIKRLFRNGRIIGRRFRLVHVFYGTHIIETATFRQDPGGKNGNEDEEDLLILEDNVFGTAEEDARRRDFTINGLFYDPTSDEVIDYVGGLADLEAGLIRTIGDPSVRMAEDPVRILRAVKFATRLGFRVEEETWRAMTHVAADLARAARPRVLEEILRLLRSGTSLGAMRMLRECGALRVIMPDLFDHLGSRDDPDPEVHDRADRCWRQLEALDAYLHEGHHPTNALCIAALFLPLAEHHMGERPRDPAGFLAAADEAMEPFAQQMKLSRRDSHRARRILSMLPRFTQSSRRRFSPLLFMHSEEFPEALALFRLHCMARGQGWDVFEAWAARYHRALETSPAEIQAARSKRRRRPRRPSKASQEPES
jgi:poly(A) polymerase